MNLYQEKANATVVMNTEDYKKKIEELLDPTTYKRLKKDIKQASLRKINTLIGKSSLSEIVKVKITKTEA